MGDRQGHEFHGNQWTSAQSGGARSTSVVKKNDYGTADDASRKGTARLIEAWRLRASEADQDGKQAQKDFAALQARWKNLTELQNEERAKDPSAPWKVLAERAEARMQEQSREHRALEPRAKASKAREAVEKVLNAPPGRVTMEGGDEMRRVLTGLVPDATEADLRTLAMALPGSDVRVRHHGGSTKDPVIILSAEGGGIVSAERVIRRHHDGTLVIRNVGIEIDPALKGGGLGTVLFAEQVATARKMGVGAITADAARALDLNGYYTWARMGFEGTGMIQGGVNERPREVRISEQMQTPEGRREWRRRGNGFDGTFSLKPDSYSMRTLQKYLRRGN